MAAMMIITATMAALMATFKVASAAAVAANGSFSDYSGGYCLV